MSPMPWSDAALEAIAALVARETGMRFDRHNLDRTEQIVLRLSRRHGQRDAAAYLDALRDQPALVRELIGELAVNETWFFRDPAQFDVLARVILPERLALAAAQARRVRLWSAGCASGEEAWSLAMLAHELGVADRVEIVATDLSTVALERARAAVYRKWSLRGASARRAERWLQRAANDDGEARMVSPQLRPLVRWRVLNLAGDEWPSRAAGIGDFDVILCRNVLMYLDAATRQRVVRGFVAALQDGGWLLTSPADPAPDALENRLERQHTLHCTAFRRVSEPAAQPALALAEPTWSAATEAAPLRELSSPPQGSPARPAPPRAQPSMADAPAAPAEPSAAHSVTSPAEPDDVAAAIAVVTNIARRDPIAALEKCARLRERFPDAALLYGLEAVLLLGERRYGEALVAARAALYLEPALPSAHALAATVLERLDEPEAALRAWRNTARLLRDWPDDAPLPLTDDEPAAAVARAAATHVARLEARLGRSPGAGRGDLT